MRPEPDITRVVRSWLDEGVDRMPDRVLDSVLERVPTTPQRRPVRSAWRLPFMITSPRLAALAACLLVASVAAFALIARPAPVASSPSPSASPSSSFAPASSPSIAPSQPPSNGVQAIGVMAPGQYRVEAPFSLPFQITFPTPWKLGFITGTSVGFTRANSLGSSAWVSVDVVTSVVKDPCHPDLGNVSPAPVTIGDMATAFSQMKGFTASSITDATLTGGFRAKVVTVTNAIDTETAGCTGGPMLPMFGYADGKLNGGTNGGGKEHLWIVNVHDDLVVIDAESFPGTVAAAIAELGPVAESIVFE